jgi:hypothetical protein
VPIALVGALAFGALRRAEPRARRLLGTAALGMLLGMLPLVGTIPSVRLLLITSFGGSLLIGAIIWESGVLLLMADEGRWRAWVRALFTIPIAIVHLGFGARFTHDHAHFWRNMVGAIRAKHLAAEIDDGAVAGQELVLINAGGEIAAQIYPPWVRRSHGAPLPRRWRVLANANVSQRAVRVSDDTLELGAQGGRFFQDPTSQMFRAPSRPFSPGDQVEVPGLSITVLAVDGWAPTRMRYRFSSSLDDPNRVFLVLENGRMRRALMPPVGGEFIVPPFG